MLALREAFGTWMIPRKQLDISLALALIAEVVVLPTLEAGDVVHLPPFQGHKFTRNQFRFYAS
jgi:hypothetical protein